MNDPIDIRAATAGDATAIAAVQIASARWGYSHFLPRDYLAALSPPAFEAMWRDRIAQGGRGHAVWVAEDGRGVIAFAATGASDDPDAAQDTGELGFLYVTPERAGNGIGRRLLDQTIERLAVEGFREATLWVFADNERARRFYERAGWSADGAEVHKDRGGAPVLQLRYRRDLHTQRAGPA